MIFNEEAFNEINSVSIISNEKEDSLQKFEGYIKQFFNEYSTTNSSKF